MCTGLPNNEDWTCGYSSPLPSIDKHHYYFGIKVGDRCGDLAHYLQAVPHADEDLRLVRIVEDEESGMVLAYDDVTESVVPRADALPPLTCAGVLLALAGMRLLH